MATDDRAQVWAKTGGKCWYCGTQTSPWKDFHVDHLLAKSKGGTDALENLVPSCQTCNISKGGKTLGEYVTWYREKHQQACWFEQFVVVMVEQEVEEEDEKEDEEDHPPNQPDMMQYEAWITALFDLGEIHPTLPLVTIALLSLYYTDWDLTSEGDEYCFGIFYIWGMSHRHHIPQHEILAHLFEMETLGFLEMETNGDYGVQYRFFIGKLIEAIWASRRKASEARRALKE